MFKIYSASNIQEVYLVQGLLTEAGIESRILNEYAQGGMGEIPFTQAYPEIWLVNKADTDKAGHIIQQFETRQQGGAERRCKHCHESSPDTFETCWACGNTLIDD